MVRKRQQGEKGMSVFACPHTEGSFHIGHRADASSIGEIDRSRLRSHAVRTVGS